jgi:hypothetical protein
MTIEAPISKFKLNTLKIYIAACILFGAWFAYDGFVNPKFIKDHTKNGVGDDKLVFNQKAPLVLLAVAALIAIYWFSIKNKKLTADDNGLKKSGKLSIPYETIEKIDKTYFKSKGFFVITFTNSQKQQQRLKISERKYDNLPAILDRLAEKISQ